MCVLSTTYTSYSTTDFLLATVCGQTLISIVVINFTVCVLYRVTKLMKRENKEARTCQLMILALIMCLMMLSQFFSIYCEITKEPIPSWIIALSGYTYFTSQISILVYCWSVSGRITSQSNDQTLRNLEEKLQQDILHEINNEFVRLFKD